MKYEDRIDIAHVKKHLKYLSEIQEAIGAVKSDMARSYLYLAYDSLLECLIEFVGTQWSKSTKEVTK